MTDMTTGDPPAGDPLWAPLRQPSPAEVEAATAAADALVTTADPLLNEALAGGLRAGELCGFFATDLAAARHRVLLTVNYYLRERAGRVLYVAMSPPAAAAVLRAPDDLRGTDGPLFVREGPRDFQQLRDLAETYTGRYAVGLIVLDSLDAITPQAYAQQWERDAQVTRDAKALARTAGTPVIITCPANLKNRQDPYTDSLIADADLLVRADRDPLTLRKHRHGETRLKGRR